MIPKEALKCLLDALNELEELNKRDTPKKVEYVKLFGDDVPTCPNCHSGVLDPSAFESSVMYKGKFCAACGQQIDWDVKPNEK